MSSHESLSIAQTRLLLEFVKDIKAWRIAGDHGRKERENTNKIRHTMEIAARN